MAGLNPPVVHAGERYGRLVVLNEAERDPSGRRQYLAKCDCGNEKVVPSARLRTGWTRSCGCLRREKGRSFTGSKPRHGHAKRAEVTPTYKVWSGIIQRCENPRANRYENYGGRGITVCARWRDSFENFLADMGEKPDGESIDRIDNDGNYEPSNCRWATPKEQAQNRRPRRHR